MAAHGEDLGGLEEVDILLRRGYRPGDKVLLYDGVCNLCNGWVNFVIDRDAQSHYKFASLQGEAGRALMARVGKNPDDLSTLVLVEWQQKSVQQTPLIPENGAIEQVFIKSEAVLRVVEDVGGRIMGTGAYTVRNLIPRIVRDFVYSNCVAPNRYLLFGKSESCRRITPALKPRFLDLDQTSADPQGLAVEGRAR